MHLLYRQTTLSFKPEVECIMFRESDKCIKMSPNAVVYIWVLRHGLRRPKQNNERWDAGLFLPNNRWFRETHEINNRMLLHCYSHLSGLQDRGLLWVNCTFFVAYLQSSLHVISQCSTGIISPQNNYSWVISLT